MKHDGSTQSPYPTFCPLFAHAFPAGLGRRWTTALILKLLDVAWDFWDFCNPPALVHFVTKRLMF